MARIKVFETRQGVWAKSLALTAGLLAVGSGCTHWREYVNNGYKVGPQYSRPPAPVAEDWIDKSDNRVSRNLSEHRDWWKVFNDPHLDRLVCLAADQNLTLREAGYRVLASRAELGVAVGRFFPQEQSVNLGFTQTALSTAVANRQFIAQAYYPLFNQGANLAWELDFWGKYRRSIEAASDDLDAKIEKFDGVMVTLLGDVADSYILMRFFERQAELSKTVADFQKTSLILAQARFRAGTASELDVDQAQSDLSKTLSDIPMFERFSRLEANRLCQLLGISPQDLQKEMGPGGIPTAPVEVAVGMPAELLARRPDVREAERKAAAACAKIGVAVSELYPHISLVGNLGWGALQYSNLWTQPAFYGTVGPTFHWNVLQYGRLINHIRFQDAEFQAAVANYQNTVVTAGMEVENGLVMFLKGQERAKELRTAVEAATRAANIAQVQYKAGTTDFNRVSLLQEKLLSRQLDLANAEQEIARGLVHTFRALGGGWQIRLDGCDPGDGNPAGVSPRETLPGELLPVPRPDLPKPDLSRPASPPVSGPPGRENYIPGAKP